MHALIVTHIDLFISFAILFYYLFIEFSSGYSLSLFSFNALFAANQIILSIFYLFTQNIVIFVFSSICLTSLIIIWLYLFVVLIDFILN